MSSHNGRMGNRQALSGPAAYPLGRKERVEHLVRVFRSDPAAVIGDGNLYHAVRRRRAECSHSGGHIGETIFT